MICEYPEYYEKFRCIGGKCPDTCCAGWEVDVDADSAAYYRGIRGEFGERLRKHMKSDGDGCYFPLTEDRRCPFLNSGNLCDIYTALGEESLCQVCTEYPRYFMNIGNYEQIDMSLSCMELARIFFEDTGDIRYIRAENDAEGEMLRPEDTELLTEVMALRNESIRVLQDRTIPFPDFLYEIAGMTDTSFPELQEPEIRKAVDEEILQLMEKFEILDERWSRAVSEVREHLPETEDTEAEFMQSVPEAETWFRRLSVYLVYRYYIDTCLNHDIEKQQRLVFRSIRMIKLLCVSEYLRNGHKFGIGDMTERAHLFSKEVEHSEENLEYIKE